MSGSLLHPKQLAWPRLSVQWWLEKREVRVLSKALGGPVWCGGSDNSRHWQDPVGKLQQWQDTPSYPGLSDFWKGPTSWVTQSNEKGEHRLSTHLHFPSPENPARAATSSCQNPSNVKHFHSTSAKTGGHLMSGEASPEYLTYARPAADAFFKSASSFPLWKWHCFSRYIVKKLRLRGAVTE